VCLLIYHVADHRDTSQIRLTWQQHLQSIHSHAVERGASQPWEAVAEGVRSLGSRLRLSESTFPVDILLPMLEKYSAEPQRNFAPPNWVVDLFSKLQVPEEKLFDVLEAMFYMNESPFAGPGRKVISADLIWVIQHWLQDSIKGGGMIFGSEAGALRVDQMLQTLVDEGNRAGLDDEMSRMCRLVRDRIAQLMH
jgi:nuclear pore complex protein Nup155